MADISKRFEQNPLIGPSDVKPSSPQMQVECVMNPGAFEYAGKIWLVMRIAERPKPTEEKVWVPYFNPGNGIDVMEFNKSDSKVVLSDPRYVIYDNTSYLSTLSHLRLMCSDDGVHFYEPEDIDPFILGAEPLEEFGVEDCRVTEMNGEYLLTYTQVSRSGVGVGLIQTRNWTDMERKSMIFPPHNKDCAIFNEKVNGKYYCFHRPSGLTLGGNYMWLASSDNLTHWGDYHCLMHTRPNMWDCERIGAGAAPIKTSEGWLAIYHGADNEHRYCLGALLLDLNDPKEILARSDEPIMEPLADYEINGFFGNVIFTNGHIVRGDEVLLYYGAADTVICGARLSIRDILKTL